ncbi:MAG: hypothetical protein H6551_13445 [Chitinophagales bacterium]|nr:hypothetical protein [Chitinophagaceae bacterium]MCB9066138.1 hypothetical protein [Chitinophagales bacterium]
MKRLTKNEQLKILFIMMTGVFMWFIDSYSYQKTVRVGAIIANMIASIVLFVGIGVIFFYIVKLIRRSKSTKSILRNGIDYGFLLSVAYVVLLIVNELLR